jgi:hypothetical protein
VFLALTVPSFLAVVAFNLSYGIGDIYVFYIPAYLIWALWIAAGVGGVAGLTRDVRRKAKDAKRKAEGVGGFLVSLFPHLLALLLPAWLLITHFAAVDQSSNTAARQTWEERLAQPIPANTLLVSNDRDEMTPQWYLRYVEGIRPDVTGLFPLIRPEPAWADVGGVIVEALRSGRPVYLVKPMPGLEVKFRLEPAGAFVRVLGLAVAQPAGRMTDVLYGGALRLAGYDLLPAGLAPGGSVAVTLRWQPAKRLDVDYTTFVQLLNADGAKIGQSDHRPGGVYYPTSLWRPGETLADVHVLNLASNLGRPPYTILVGLYTAAPDLRHLGKPQRVGEIGP